MFGSKQACATSRRFFRQTSLVILSLLVAHLVCFAVSITMIQSQEQYVQEVDVAGSAVVEMHQAAINAR
jgi:hypothetical protein